MKRWSIILGAAVVAAWLVVDAVRDLPDAIRYFAARPGELFYVAAIAISGGLMALGFDRLSPRAKRQVSVFAWGAGASTMTAYLGWIAFRLASLSSLGIEFGAGRWVLLAMLLCGGLATGCWIQFYRLWKAGVSP